MHEIDLRHLCRADFELLAAWLDRPHVARWWNHGTSAAQVEADFGDVVDGRDPADVFIASTGGRPFGLVQRHRFADHPEYMAELQSVVEVPPTALSVDYFVGDPDLLNLGYGAAMVSTLVRRSWYECDCSCVIVAVVVGNEASWRLLERAGMRRAGKGSLEPDNPIDGWTHFVYRMNRPVDLAP